MQKLIIGGSKMYENNLKYIREYMEMTQKELGSVFNVAESTYSGWETGRDVIPLKHLYKFSLKYGYSMDYLLKLNSKNVKYDKIDSIDRKMVGEKLKKIRKDLNLTQQQIADECMISQTTYSNYELGNNLISTMSLYTICKNHNISMDSIFKEHR